MFCLRRIRDCNQDVRCVCEDKGHRICPNCNTWVTCGLKKISMDCQEDLNHIARDSLKCSPAGLWSETGGGGSGMWLLHSCPPTESPSGGETDLRRPPHPKNVKLLQCDARQSLERKLRKFSGCSFRCLHAYYSILFSKENDLTAIAR